MHFLILSIIAFIGHSKQSNDNDYLDQKEPKRYTSYSFSKIAALSNVESAIAKINNIKVPHVAQIIESALNIYACILNKDKIFFADNSIFSKSRSLEILENGSLKMNIFMGW